MNRIPRLCRILLFGLLIPAAAAAAETPPGLTAAQLATWLESYGQAWETRNADLAVTLFSKDASYQDVPFDPPHQGHEGIHAYWSGVTKDQRNVKFGSEILAVSGSTGIAHWTAEFDVHPSGPHLQLNGVFVLDFDADGKCRRLREWWHLKAPDTGPAPQ